MPNPLPLFLVVLVALVHGRTADGQSADAEGRRAGSAERVRYDGHKVVRARLASMRELRTMLALSDDPWSESTGVGASDWRLAPEAFDALGRTGIEFDLLIEDVQALIDAERARIEAGAEGGVAGASFFDDYRPWAEVDAYLDELVALRPDIAQIVEIGPSIEGRLVRGIRIGVPSKRPRPVFVAAGCQHAREWITVMVTSWIADALVRGHGEDAEITALLEAMDFLVIPVVNPDGYVHAWDVARLWRKNRRVNGDGTFGVDTNRNWGAGWGGPGSSGTPSSETYRGPAPFSEPETDQLRALLEATPGVVAFLDIHSYSQLILAPWGYTDALPPDHDAFQALGAAKAQRIAEVDGKTYLHGPTATTIYLASGVASDWAYDELGIWSFGYELRDTGEFGFILPADQIEPNALEVMPAVLHMAAWTAAPGHVLFPEPPPTEVVAERATPIVVRLVAISGEIDPSSAVLVARIDDGAPQTTPLTSLGDGLFEATLPAAPCASTIAYAVEAATVAGAHFRAPESADDAFFAVAIGTSDLLVDDLETESGWLAGAPGDTATAGQWVRVEPNGSFVNGVAVQPGSAFSGSFCFVTGQHFGGGAGTSDVDNGTTTLRSPVIDLSGVPAGLEIRIAYRRWFSNGRGAAPFDDPFVVELTADGGATWLPVETVGPGMPEVDGGWFAHEFALDEAARRGGSLQLRFVARDLDPQSLVEAAVDLLVVRAVGCPAASQPGDLDGDGVVDGADLGLLLGAWGPCGSCIDCPADLNGDCAVDGADLGLLLGAWS